MFDFVLYALVGISWVLTLAFTVLLGLLCIRIRSKGLIIITAVLVFPPTLGLISSYVIQLYIDQWAIGELNNWFTQHMTIEGFAMLYNFVSRVLHDGLLALGAFLIYREWSGGKIRWNPLKSSEVANHA